MRTGVRLSCRRCKYPHIFHTLPSEVKCPKCGVVRQFDKWEKRMFELLKTRGRL